MTTPTPDPTTELAERVARVLDDDWGLSELGVKTHQTVAVDLIAAELRPLVEERDALQLLVEGKDGLLAAYRLGRPPSERTWNKLEQAEKKLAATRSGKEGGA